jgi:FtsP/CotA-like multicopper oxidase with cupredoxin domain
MSRSLLGKAVSVAGVVALVALLAVVGKAWWDSRIPGTYSVMDYGAVDTGGGKAVDPHAAHSGGRSVADLRGPSGAPDVRFALTAKEADIHLATGRLVHALTFDGQSPGPELRVREGDLVEVVLRNEDVEDGVTIHWHGVDVPNAEDGVAGVTQDAVLPGESYTYRFRAEQVGTFWYHSHQISSEAVQRGLFGVLVIEPREKPPGIDLVAAAHTYDGVLTLNRDDSGYRQRVPAGTPVRVRLVNTDSVVHHFSVDRTPFRVLAIDGTDVHEPGELQSTSLEVAAGGRMDIGYVQPGRIVQVGLVDGPGIALSPSNGPGGDSASTTSEFDPLSYGRPAPTPFTASSRFDRRFDLTITKKVGFFDGKPGRHWAIDGHVYPDVPMFAVEQGDLVEVTIHNGTGVVHPMHLHGHHALVLSRNGQAATGSPWWVDTLNVDQGDTYVVAFRAGTPGIWMDHCHNLGHAAAGLTMHLAYAGVTTPFEVGASHHNEPE